MAELRFVTNIKHGYQEGELQYGNLRVRVCPGIDVLSSSYNDDIMLALDTTLRQLDNLLNGKTENEYIIFKLCDTMTDISVKDDIFTLRWGGSGDTFNQSILTCYYSQNKTELLKLFKYLYDSFNNCQQEEMNAELEDVDN